MNSMHENLILAALKTNNLRQNGFIRRIFGNGPFHFLSVPPPTEDLGNLTGRRGVFKGRFCWGNCVSTFDRLIIFEGGSVSAL